MTWAGPSAFTSRATNVVVSVPAGASHGQASTGRPCADGSHNFCRVAPGAGQHTLYTLFRRRNDREQSIPDRNLDAQAVEATARVVLHVFEVVWIHELAVRIE